MNNEQSLIKWLVTISVFYQFVLTINSDALRLGFRGAGLLILIFILFFKVDKKIKFSNFFASIVVCLLILINVFFSNIEISMSLFLLFAQIVLSLLSISFSSTVKIIKPTRRYIYQLLCIAILYNLASSFNEEMYVYSTAGAKFLLLGYDNCNFTAIMLFFQLILFLVCSKENGNKIFNTALWFFVLYLIYLTGSRAILAAAFFTLIYYFFNFKIKLPNWVVVLLCLFPTFFIFFYLYLYDSGMENIKILGKSLFSGRQYVYNHYLNILDTPIKVLFGNLKESMFENAHNAPLAFISSIGVVGAISVYRIYISELVSANSGTSDKISSMAIIAILACFIHSCAESAGFLAGFPIITYMFLLYSLAFHSQDHIL